jgi:formate dehydrogenase subunit beta
MNAAKVVSKLTRRPLGERIAVVLRPCEIRAFIELVKLKQGTLDDVVLIGVDCYGSYSNINYPRFSGEDGMDSTLRFLANATNGEGTAFDDFDLSPACKACEYPIPENADLLIGLIGMDMNNHLLLQANTPRGEELMDQLGLEETTPPESRKGAVESLLEARTTYRDKMFEETSDATSDVEKLTHYLANCVNCYNCRVACPVCYCKECVFVTDVFDHDPSQYLRWAKRKGIIKMPTDTVFFHITRLAHMSTACIGCGQCSNACPNDIPVMEIFRTVAHYTQTSFDYEAGRSVDDEPPLSVFKEDEYKEVTGGKD